MTSLSKRGLQRPFAALAVAAGCLLTLGCDANRSAGPDRDDRPRQAVPAAVEDPTPVIVQLEREWAAALARKDLAWYQRHVAPGYRTILNDGRILSRAEVIAHMQSAPPAQGLRLEQAQVSAHGNAAVATTTQSFARRDGRTGRLRVTDVWMKSPSGRWMVVHSHESWVAGER